MTPEQLSAASHALLTFNSPMSLGRARRLIEHLAAQPGERALDLGCGWGELLISLVTSVDGVQGDGIDTARLEIARGRRVAPSSVRLHIGDAGTWDEPADIVLCLGASFAFGGTAAALAAVRGLLRPGGRALIGEGIWAHPPTEAALRGLDATEDELTDLRGLLALAGTAGLEVIHFELADQEEWDHFEASWCEGLRRTGDPEALNLAARHEEGYRKGYRGMLGFAYLICIGK
jgi:cyclopropane fatty-acyl-phospholipid synthase-like methyltransferase